MAPASRAPSDLRARETHSADTDGGGGAANEGVARTTPGRSALAVYRRARARPGPPLRSGPRGACGGLDPPSARPRLASIGTTGKTAPGRKAGSMKIKWRVLRIRRRGRRPLTAEDVDETYARSSDKLRRLIRAKLSAVPEGTA